MANEDARLSYDKLTTMTESELIGYIDGVLRATPSTYQLGLAMMHRDELLRREQDKALKRQQDLTDQMARWTTWIGIMTLVMLVATLVNLLLACRQ